MKHKNYRIAIIGCGRIAGHHARNIQATPGLQLAAVCDLDGQKAATYSSSFDVEGFTSYHAMLAKYRDVDVVVIATPSGMHFEHTIDVIERYKKSVIVEKPTFMRPREVDAAYATARSHGVQIFPVFQNRNNKAILRVQRALTTGELGELRTVAVRVRWCRPQRYYDLAPWRGTYAQDGGALTNQGIHHVDILRFLGGSIDSVTATMRTLGAEIEVEDTAVGIFQYASGAVGTLEVTTAARPDDFEASISFVGSKGLAQVGGIAVNELQLFSPNPTECSLYSEDFSGNVYGNGHAAIYKSILMALATGASYPVAQTDCKASIGLLHAFYCSNELGRAVRPDEALESARLGISRDDLAKLYRSKP